MWIPDEVHRAAQEKLASSLASSSGNERTVDPGRPQICQNYDEVDLKKLPPIRHHQRFPGSPEQRSRSRRLHRSRKRTSE